MPLCENKCERVFYICSKLLKICESEEAMQEQRVLLMECVPRWIVLYIEGNMFVCMCFAGLFEVIGFNELNSSMQDLGNGNNRPIFLLLQR